MVGTDAVESVDAPGSAFGGRSILYLNNYSGRDLGGGEVHMQAVILGARDAGANVHLVCQAGTDVAKHFADLDVPVTEIELGWRSARKAVGEITQVLDSLSADIVHSNGYWTNILSRRLPRREGLRVLNSILVDPDAPRLSGASRAEQVARNTVDKRTVSRVDAFAPITRALAAKLEGLGVDPHRVTVISGGVDLPGIESEAARHGAGFDRSSDGPVVGMVGRLEEVKGVLDFVEAAELIAASHPDVQFVLGGTGTLESTLREKIVARRLGDRLQLAGRVPSAVATFAACDVVVNPSLSEGFGLVSVEAMALAKPVVATRVGGTPEVVHDAVTGLLVPPRDPRALAEAVSALLADPERAAEMGAAGRRRVEEHFTIERMQSRYVTLYEELLAGSADNAGDTA